jgi:delta 1-pyrroline-5-carboxylate dehydrogenase
MTGKEIAEVVVLTAMNQATMYIPQLVKNPGSKRAQALKREAVALRAMLDQLIATIPDPSEK